MWSQSVDLFTKWTFEPWTFLAWSLICVVHFSIQKPGQAGLRRYWVDQLSSVHHLTQAILRLRAYISKDDDAMDLKYVKTRRSVNEWMMIKGRICIYLRTNAKICAKNHKNKNFLLCISKYNALNFFVGEFLWAKICPFLKKCLKYLRLFKIMLEIFVNICVGQKT